MELDVTHMSQRKFYTEFAGQNTAWYFNRPPFPAFNHESCLPQLGTSRRGTKGQFAALGVAQSVVLILIMVAPGVIDVEGLR